MLSVVIPSYNTAATLSQQLEALTHQDPCPEPWEVVVSDNGSTDDTLLVVERYRSRLSRLTLVDASARRGAGFVRNMGVKAATGDKLAFCDSDDLVAKDWVAKMSQALDRHDFVAGRMEGERLNAPWMLKTRQCPQEEGLQPYHYPPFLPHAAACNLGVKRCWHEAAGGFDESLPRLQDTDYCWRLQLMGVELHYAPEVLVHYRFRESLSGMFRQARLWGEYNVLLYKRYRAVGMPGLSWQVGLTEWLSLLRQMRRIRNKTSYARWLWRLGWRLGRLYGSLKYQTFAL